MLKSTLVIAGDTDQGVKALEQLDRSLGQVNGAANDVAHAVSAAMQVSLQAIVENTAATNQSIAALIAATGAARQRADASSAGAQAERAAAQAANDNARAQASLAQQAAALRSAIDPMYAAQQKFNQALDVADTLLAEGIIQQHEYASAVAMARQQLQDHAKAVAGSSDAMKGNAAASKEAADGLKEGEVSTAQAKNGYINLGRQMQDVAVMAQGGMSLGQIISTQGGQIADAVAQMGGRFAGFASFLAGPWGAAVLVGASMLANLATSLLEAGSASEEAKGKTYDFADGLDVVKLKANEAADAMKQLADATKSAIKVQGDFLAVMGQTADAAVAMLEKRIADNQAAVKGIQENWLSLSNLNPAVAGWNYVRIGTLNDQIAKDKEALANARLSQTNFELATSQRKVAGELDAATAATNQYAEAVGKLEARYKASKDDPVGSTQAGTYFSQTDYETELRKVTVTRDKALEAAREAKKKHREPKDNSAAVIKFDDDVAGRIAKVANQFAEMPTGIQKANAALLDLDAIQRDILAKAKGKNGNLIDVPGLTAQIGAARTLIENGLTKPFRDYVEKSSEQVSIDRLIVAGRQDEADALRVICGLQKQMGPLSEDQASKVLEIVSAERRRAMVLRDQQALIQANVSAATNMRTALNETVAEALKGRGSFDKIFSSIGNSYVNIMSQRIVESMFGDSLRAFEDEATRNFRKATDVAGQKVTDFGNVVAAAAAKIGGTGAASQAELASADSLVTFLDGAFSKAAANDNGVPVSTGADIVVPGRRSKNSEVAGVASPLLGLTNSLFTRLGVGIPDSITKGLKPLFTRLETALPDAVQGAMLGGTASRLVNGSGSSSVGGSIGGAIGQEMGKKFLSTGLETISKGLGAFAGPLGSIVGGVVGGMLGDLFTTTKAGTTVITGANKASTTGSTQEVSAGLTNMGNSITSTLESVAAKFNTSVGDFAVSIGQYKDYFRVSASGSSHVGDKYYPNSAGSDILYDGTDQATATLIAIQNAIADGAIKGLSKAVQKAMSSSSNIESALREALKVQEVELTIGGIGAQLQKSFREQEQTAAERLRIARQYGFDMVATEKANADERVALQKKLLEDQVGSLQQIIDEMSSGALFEGSAVDQRAAILAKITTAKADVAAGKDGASDTLAKLLEQLNTVSKEAYGTTAQYQADRAMIADVARDAITAANQRISDAAAMTTAQAQTNSALDEANDQLARIASAMGLTVDYLKQLADSGYVSSSALADLAKTS